MNRSILNEKISRRGCHLSREYAIDPLEILFVREVMRTNVVAIPRHVSIGELSRRVESSHGTQHLYPVMASNGDLAGVVTRKDIQRVQERSMTLAEAMKTNIVTAFPDEPLRLVVYRMAETGLTRMPVVNRENPLKLVGMVSLTDLLRPSTRDL